MVSKCKASTSHVIINYNTQNYNQLFSHVKREVTLEITPQLNCQHLFNTILNFPIVLYKLFILL